MAEGWLPILEGEEENKSRDAYIGSVKEYEVEVLVGIQSDSGDLLGIVPDKSFPDLNFIEDKFKNEFFNFPSQFDQIIPMHSNRKVRGKRLWWWILQGVAIGEDERPKNSVRIYERSYLGCRTIGRIQLQEEIDRIKGYFSSRFRMDTVYASWSSYFSRTAFSEYVMIKCRLTVSSGFYVRTFVEALSQKVGLPLIVYSLRRTQLFFNR